MNLWVLLFDLLVPEAIISHELFFSEHALIASEEFNELTSVD